MDQLADFRHTMESCNHCGQCKVVLGPKTRGYDFAEICPIHMQFHFDAYSGQGLLHIAQELLDGAWQPEPGLRDLVYACTACGACDINCKSIRDMEVMDTILALREHLVDGGCGPMPQHAQMAERVERTHNIYGRPHAERTAWAQEAGAAAATTGGVAGGPASTAHRPASAAAPVAYFAGCAASYQRTDIARNTLRILAAAGIECTLLGADEHCCGGPLWRTGQRAAAARQVQHNLAALERRGVRTIVTSCAECFGTLRGFYPRVAGFAFEVRHISEIVQQALDAGRLKLTRPVAATVTWHDPCLLGRLSEPYVPWNGATRAFGEQVPPKPWRRGTQGAYDAPRRVLGAIRGVKVVEMVRNEENALCCGGGGGVLQAFPEQARNTAAERLREARSTGADTLASACPFCQDTLAAGVADEGGALRYRDFTELVVSALEP
ncbi:MAG: (Fe-S)-binding protein [Gammaproteobacteria bacterium]|nr:(Fe-S)-binding protein [Gammaproteobacteria bacterium]